MRTTEPPVAKTRAAHWRRRVLSHGVHAAVALAALSAAAVWLFSGRGVGAPPMAAALPASAPAARFAEQLDVSAFQRGNLHAHSAMTDGDSPAQVVFAWYREHGYNFLALTDHNRHLDPGRYPDASTPDFVLIPGEELTMVAAELPIHVNALCTKRRIGGGSKFANQRAALAWAIDEIRAQDGVALINHPNFHDALGVDDIASATGAHLLEIYSGHPAVKSDGDRNRPSVEANWDELLSRGYFLPAVAVDDMHWLSGKPRNVPKSRPGTGWVEVFGHETSQEAICDGLSKGRLYASSGPRLSRIAVEAHAMTVWVETPGSKVEFVGPRGELLAATTQAAAPVAQAAEPAAKVSVPSTYRLKGDEGYVRARVTGPDGQRAWTQAYRVERSAR